jgi:hypothetical protein
MHLDISLASTLSKEPESNTRADDPAVYFLSINKTAAIFADSSDASLIQKSMAEAKGKAASPFFSSHCGLLISVTIFGSYFESETHEGKSKTVTIETNILQTFLTTAKNSETRQIDQYTIT